MIKLLKDKILELCAIDIRSLALFRIGLGLILLVDLMLRSQDLREHYSDEGVLPRSVVMQGASEIWNFSLHFLSGMWQVQLVLFVIAALAAFALLMGFKTRIATVVSWILLISLHTRNPLILQGGDIVMRVLLFWAMFLPLGATWSLDRYLGRPWPFSNRVVSFGSLALLLQICFIYWFSAVLKNDPTWHTEGTAIWYALNVEQFATHFGTYLLNYPSLLKALTFSTYYLELIGPFFAFSPLFSGPLRLATAIAFILFHLGLIATMELAHFSYICIVGWLVFIPPWFWEKIYGPSHEQRPWKARIISNVIAALFILYILLGNMRATHFNVPKIPSAADAVGELTRVDQYWNMFAPFPLRVTGWFVIPGKLRDGTEVDLYTGGGPVTWDKPTDMLGQYKNDRWRALMMNLLLKPRMGLFFQHYARFLCREWNANHEGEKQLVSFDVDFMMRINSYEDPNQPYERKEIWHHNCFAKSPYDHPNGANHEEAPKLSDR